MVFLTAEIEHWISHKSCKRREKNRNKQASFFCLSIVSVMNAIPVETLRVWEVQKGYHFLHRRQNFYQRTWTIKTITKLKKIKKMRNLTMKVCRNPSGRVWRPLKGNWNTALQFQIGAKQGPTKRRSPTQWLKIEYILLWFLLRLSFVWNGDMKNRVKSRR